MGNTHCKQCKVKCVDKEEIKRELCQTCSDKREFGNCIFLKCSQCRHQAENPFGYLPKSQRDSWICQKCSENNEGQQHYALMCQRCNKVYETKVFPPENLRKYVNCDRCADVVADQLEKGTYKIFTMENANGLKCIYPVEMEALVLKWMHGKSEQLRIEAN